MKILALIELVVALGTSQGFAISHNLKGKGLARVIAQEQKQSIESWEELVTRSEDILYRENFFDNPLVRGGKPTSSELAVLRGKLVEVKNFLNYNFQTIEKNTVFEKASHFRQYFLSLVNYFAVILIREKKLQSTEIDFFKLTIPKELVSIVGEFNLIQETEKNESKFKISSFNFGSSFNLKFEQSNTGGEGSQTVGFSSQALEKIEMQALLARFDFRNESKASSQLLDVVKRYAIQSEIDRWVDLSVFEGSEEPLQLSAHLLERFPSLVHSKSAVMDAKKSFQEIFFREKFLEELIKLFGGDAWIKHCGQGCVESLQIVFASSNAHLAENTTENMMELVEAAFMSIPPELVKIPSGVQLEKWVSQALASALDYLEKDLFPSKRKEFEKEIIIAAQKVSQLQKSLAGNLESTDEVSASLSTHLSTPLNEEIDFPIALMAYVEGLKPTITERQTIWIAPSRAYIGPNQRDAWVTKTHPQADQIQAELIRLTERLSKRTTKASQRASTSSEVKESRTEARAPTYWSAADEWKKAILERLQIPYPSDPLNLSALFGSAGQAELISKLKLQDYSQLGSQEQALLERLAKAGITVPGQLRDQTDQKTKNIQSEVKKFSFLKFFELGIHFGFDQAGESSLTKAFSGSEQDTKSKKETASDNTADASESMIEELFDGGHPKVLNFGKLPKAWQVFKNKDQKKLYLESLMNAVYFERYPILSSKTDVVAPLSALQAAYSYQPGGGTQKVSKPVFEVLAPLSNVDAEIKILPIIRKYIRTAKENIQARIIKVSETTDLRQPIMHSNLSLLSQIMKEQPIVKPVLRKEIDRITEQSWLDRIVHSYVHPAMWIPLAPFAHSMLKKMWKRRIPGIDFIMSVPAIGKFSHSILYLMAPVLGYDYYKLMQSKNSLEAYRAAFHSSLRVGSGLSYAGMTDAQKEYTFKKWMFALNVVLTAPMLVEVPKATRWMNIQINIAKIKTAKLFGKIDGKVAEALLELEKLGLEFESAAQTFGLKNYSLLELDDLYELWRSRARTGEITALQMEKITDAYQVLQKLKSTLTNQLKRSEVRSYVPAVSGAPQVRGVFR